MRPVRARGPRRLARALVPLALALTAALPPDAMSAARTPPRSSAHAPGSSHSSTDDARARQLADVFDRIAAFGFSGQVVLGERGHIVLQRSAGWADADYRVPMSDTTQLGIGSITKTFVAATVLKLQSAGKLDIQAPLARYLDGVPDDKRAITLHMLLTHTSGLTREARGVPDSAPRDSVVARILRTPLDHPPAARFQYSNSGYDLLAAVVERVTGERIGDVARRVVLAPAGMVRTGWARDWRDRGVRARGYNEWREVAAWTEWPERWRRTGSGTMVSTAADLWRMARALDDSTVLTAAEKRLMFTRWAMDDDSVGYGYGMFLTPLTSGGVMRGHGGDVDGYRAELRLYPDARTVIVLTNHDQFGLGVQRRILATMFVRLMRGDSTAVPPAVAHGEAARLDPWRGEYRLPDGGVIRVRELNGVPMVAAEGQDAANLFLPPTDSRDALADANRRSFGIVLALAGDDTATALPFFKPGERELAYRFLRENFRVLHAAFGDLREVKLLGSTYLPWSRDELRTWLRVDFTDGSQTFYLGRMKDTINDVTLPDDRPAPVLLPVAVLANGTLGAWDVFHARTIVLRHGRAGGLVIAGPDGDREAMRVR
jgi:CubicO group peptidase (beta-lactamase class C family)